MNIKILNFEPSFTGSFPIFSSGERNQRNIGEGGDNFFEGQGLGSLKTPT